MSITTPNHKQMAWKSLGKDAPLRGNKSLELLERESSHPKVLVKLDQEFHSHSK